MAFQGISEFFIPESESDLQFSADNVDYIPDTMYGKNSIHCMGMIGIITPRSKFTTVAIKRERPTKAKILEFTKNNIRLMKNDGILEGKFFAGLQFKELEKIQLPGKMHFTHFKTLACSLQLV